MEQDGQSVRNYIGDILKKQLDNYLHMNSDTAAEALLSVRFCRVKRKEKSLPILKSLPKKVLKK
jgi:hypothetical protein